MSYCLNPNCQKPQNTDGAKFCQNCGSKLLLKERYRAIKLIGQGGFGKTFLAVDEDKPSKPRCVIKQFFPQAQGTDNTQKAAELFEQEAVRLDELGKHPQIPELLAHFTQDSRQYLVQEFIDGQNLGQILEAEGAFNERQILDLLNSLLPVLQFIHSHNVVHRDIKPENIIRRNDGQLVLVDFGAAKYVTGTALLKTGTTIGSPEYIAPEQARGKAVFASDLYSLGVTCIHLLTQVSPFDLFDTSQDMWVWRHYASNSFLNYELSDILDKLIENATNRRYRLAIEVMKDLNRSQTLLNVQSLPSLSFGRKQVSTKTWQCLYNIMGYSIMAISPDGKAIAVAAAFDRTINLCELSTGNIIYTFRSNESKSGYSCFYSCLAFSLDGQILASGNNEGNIQLFQVSTGQELLPAIRLSTKRINSIAISPNSKILAGGDDNMRVSLWDMDTRTCIRSRKTSSYITSIAISPNGQTLASGCTDRTIELWQINTGKKEQVFGHSGAFGSINCIVFSPDGQVLASASGDQTIKLWELSTGREICTLTGHTGYVLSVAFSPDGQLLASGSADESIKIWQLNTKREICTITGHTDRVRSVAFSPDNQTLVSSGWDRNIKIWRCI